MAEAEKPSKAAREWIAGLLLPVAIFLYTFQKDRSDQQARELDRITAVIGSLGSASAAERSLARSYIEYLAGHGQAPPEIVALLSSNITTATTSTEAAAALRTLQAVQQHDAKLAPIVTKEVNDLPSRLYLQIRTEEDRPTAEEVQKLLSTSGLTVPGIERVNAGPAASEVRYFHAEDKAQAEELAQKLSSAGIPTAAKDSSRFSNQLSRGVPAKQLELWLAPGARLKPAS